MNPHSTSSISNTSNGNSNERDDEEQEEEQQEKESEIDTDSSEDSDSDLETETGSSSGMNMGIGIGIETVIIGDTRYSRLPTRDCEDEAHQHQHQDQHQNQRKQQPHSPSQNGAAASNRNGDTDRLESRPMKVVDSLSVSTEEDGVACCSFTLKLVAVLTCLTLVLFPFVSPSSQSSASSFIEFPWINHFSSSSSKVRNASHFHSEIFSNSLIDRLREQLDSINIPVLSLPFSSFFSSNAAASDSNQEEDDLDFPLSSDSHYYTSTENDDSTVDEWPSMVNTIRMCPPFHESHVSLAYGSRWLIHPKLQLEKYSYSFQLENIQWKTVKVKINDQEQMIDYSLQPPSSYPPPPDQACADDDELVISRRPSTSLRATTLYSPSNWRYHHMNFTTPLAERNQALARLAAYDGYEQRHSHQPIGGPLLSIELQGIGAGYQFIAYQIEWLIPGQSWRKGFLEPEPAFKLWGQDGLAIMTQLTQIENYSQTRTKEEIVVPTLLNSFSCAYRAEVDYEVFKQRKRIEKLKETSRQAGEGSVHSLNRSEFSVRFYDDLNVRQLEEMAGRINSYVAPASYHANHWQYIIFCPLPPGSVSRSFLLDQHPAGPVLRLNAVILLTAVKSLGFSGISLGLCGVRTRRVTNALIVSPMFGPPLGLGTAHLHSFINYYLFIGIEKFYFVDRFGSLKPSLLPYIRRGLVEYTYKAYSKSDPGWWDDQWLMLGYLQHSMKQESEWLFQMDFDEFLVLEHPYFTQNPNVVKPPQSPCFHSKEAWRYALRSHNRSHLIPLISSLNALDLPIDPAVSRSPDHSLGSLSTPIECKCLLHEFQHLPGIENFWHFRSNGVLYFGISEPFKSQWKAEREAAKQEKAAALAKGMNNEQSARLVWELMSESPEFPEFHSPIDIWTHRSPIPDAMRSKWFVRTLFANNVNQHQVFGGYSQHQTFTVDSQDWSLDGGLIEYLAQQIKNASQFDSIETAWESAKLDPRLPLTADVIRSTQIFPIRDGMADIDSRLSSSIPYSVLLFHFAHYFCLFRPHHYDDCTPASGMNGYRLQAGPSLKNANLTGEEEMSEEDPAMLLLRKGVGEWSETMKWNRGIDNAVQWNRNKRVNERLSQNSSSSSSSPSHSQHHSTRPLSEEREMGTDRK